MWRLLALLLLPFVASAAPAPSASDLTAIYVSGGSEVMRLEIAANGDLRIGSGRDQYWLWHDGQAYIVSAGPGGPIVERVADIAAARAEAGTRKPAVVAESPTKLVATTKTMVNGREGIIYAIRGVANPDPTWFPIYSSDPALRPIAQALARKAAVIAMMPVTDSSAAEFDKMLASATPLRIAGRELKTVENAPLPAARFALPAEPEPSAQVRDEWRSRYAPRDDVGSPAEVARFYRQTIKRAIFADGKLWLLSDLGTLTTIDPRTKTATEHKVPGTILDMCRGSDGPILLTGMVKDPTWTLQLESKSGWQPAGTIASDGERLAAMTCTGNRVTLLTAKRLIEVSSTEQKAVRLAEPFARGFVMATLYDEGDAVLVGIDAGEWGGGLHRIDRTTGMVSPIAKTTGNSCDGPLSPVCDPVNGIATLPGRPDCVVAAVGLVHMLSNGRLVRACGADIATIYYKPYTIDPWPGFDPKIPPPFNTVAFFGLSRGTDGLWAVATDGLYRIGEGGQVTFRKMPEFENIGGIWVSFALPDLVLVRTTINQRASLSGAVPMLVSRQ